MSTLSTLSLLAAFIGGVIVTLSWQTYVWPVVKAKRAVKSRIAKAVATRRANAVRRAATLKGDSQ